MENLIDKLNAEVGMTAEHSLPKDRIKIQWAGIDLISELVVDEVRHIGLAWLISGVAIDIDKRILVY
jgi:hypothetical protein